jgi:hypothetical protein
MKYSFELVLGFSPQPSIFFILNRPSSSAFSSLSFSALYSKSALKSRGSAHFRSNGARALGFAQERVE